MFHTIGTAYRGLGDYAPAARLLETALAMRRRDLGTRHVEVAATLGALGSVLWEQDDFEKAAVASMKAGGSWHEQVVEQGGKRYLRAATPIPVVLEKCAMCHPNFKDVPAGEAIGMLSYTVPVGD